LSLLLLINVSIYKLARVIKVATVSPHVSPYVSGLSPLKIKNMYLYDV